ncbi:MAG TPA: hypothetical protein VH393_02760 [Ktedonobacterales bacterium]|jgi:hypothetical protein
MLQEVAKAVPFDRIEEYKAILGDAAQASARRQTMNEVYVGLNSAFLTIFAALVVAIIPINLTWRAALRRYQEGLIVRYDYLLSIEREFQQQRNDAAGSIGFIHQANRYDQEHHSKQPVDGRLEKSLASYFVFLFLFVAVLTCALTWLVTTGLIPPLG